MECPYLRQIVKLCDYNPCRFGESIVYINTPVNTKTWAAMWYWHIGGQVGTRVCWWGRGLQFTLKWKTSLCPLPADAAGKLDVLGHDGDSLGVDGAQVGVLEEPHQVGLTRLLQRHHGRALETQVSPDSHFAFLHFFSTGMVFIPVSCTMSWTSFHSSSGTLSIRCRPLNLFLTSTV